jgi:peptidoglycan/LPS O-acetylase OafA/YrhL
VIELTAKERRGIRAATHPGYRPDIDGLRTIAVLPVVLNHAQVRGIWGGFVGVDIFFVISGYLITGILVRDLAVGRHSIAEFYRRRVLRIFPALFAMLAATTLVACFAMLPGELLRYGKSLASTTLFGSNFLFWNEAGYFAPAARLKPLLHTWSLAIEEQFYILWPLALAWIGPRRPAAARTLVLLVTAISFGIAEWLLWHDASAAFYLLPARAWELSIGAALALIPQPPRGRLVNEALGILGLLLIGYAVRHFSEATLFPGAAALLPCVGAALLILTGDRGTLAGRLLSLPPMTFIGKISYSLYLWHWPVIVFATLALFLPHTPIVTAGEIALSILLAWLSWHFVERPFRVGVSGWHTPRVLAGALIVMATTLAAAAGLWLSGGLASRLTPAQARVAAYQDIDHDTLYRAGTCFAVDRDRYDPQCLAVPAQGRSVVLLAGDSHGAHWWPGLARHQDQAAILQATRTGCKPALYPAGADDDACVAFFRTLFTQWLPAHHVDRLVLAARWGRADLPLVTATLADPRVQAAHPVLVGPVPQYTTALPRLLVFAELHGDSGLPARTMDRDVFEVDRQLALIAAQTGTPYVSMVDALCSQGQCRTWAAPDVPMQFDYGHLTIEGSISATDAVLWPALGLSREADRKHAP